MNMYMCGRLCRFIMPSTGPCHRPAKVLRGCVLFSSVYVFYFSLPLMETNTVGSVEILFARECEKKRTDRHEPVPVFKLT